MFGLTMIKDYLNEILDGSKTFDARSYPTNKIGKIALIDSKTMKIYGSIELVNCRRIDANEYCSWNKTGRFKDCIFEVEDKNKDYYAYDFINTRKLIKSIKVNVERHTWVEIPDDLEMYYSDTLF